MEEYLSKEIQNLIEENYSTVVAVSDFQPKQMTSYQSEAALEEGLIEQLQKLGYEYPDIKTPKQLEQNLRKQIERLNAPFEFSNAEWERFFKGDIANERLNIEDKTEIIQKEHIRILKLDDGTNKNIKLIDKRVLGNNRMQVINQFEQNDGSCRNRYDVTILVNGLPLVHIELKRRGENLKEAFNQIARYERESFWANNSMYEYVQLYIISNGTETKYYSNSTRYAKIKEEILKESRQKVESSTYEFTQYWSYKNNQIITDIEEFANEFLNIKNLLNILTKYCVFTTEKQLMVMRPYQIAATEAILKKIITVLNYPKSKKLTQEERGGFIWHTTGSGKTLTSFKTAQLALDVEGVTKVLFVVDRQDLDYQTMKEYDNFEKGSANGTRNAGELIRLLNNPLAKIVITTIQKLNKALKRKDDITALKENVVIIFDECHRSQFGDMHDLIVKKFKKSMMFGFTGTPIFPENATPNDKGVVKTTCQVFGGEPDDKGERTKPLHTYTVLNAIKDHNVLKFCVDYVNTIKANEDLESKRVWGIKEKEALRNPIRIEKIVRYILESFDVKTKRSETFGMSRLMNVSEIIKRGNRAEEQRQKVKIRGFNGMLATDSVAMAIAYYDEFQRQMQQEGAKQLKIATIFTYKANDDENDKTGTIEEGMEDIAENMDATSKESLARAMADYNKMFGTNYKIDGDGFSNYYKDVSLRMKNKEIDLLIVMGMFLTGFDAKTLNTLWVDKPLKMHGLLQAFSRTNRILNSVKNCGNIVCFRKLDEQMDDCFRLFGDENAGGIIKIRCYDDYYYGYDDEKGHHPGYEEIVKKLQEKFPLSKVREIIADENKNKEFIALFGKYLKTFNILMAFDKFSKGTENEVNEQRIMSMRERQDYMSWYNTAYESYTKEKSNDKESILDDIEFEIELVKQVQIDITYILALVEKYHKTNCQDREIVLQIEREIASSPDMRDKAELVKNFIDKISANKDVSVGEEWIRHVEEEKKKDLEKIINDEELDREGTYKLFDKSLQTGYIPENGTQIASILKPIPLYVSEDDKYKYEDREMIKQRVIDKLKEILNRYLNI